MIPLDPALLAAVLAEPDDDGVRLVAADWWEEHGESERAEFVRVQVELARGADCLKPLGTLAGFPVVSTACDCRPCTLGRREQELEDRHGGGWFDFPEGVAEGPISYRFRRGLVHALRLNAADWLAHAAALYWHPDQQRPCPPTAQPVREVTLTSQPKLQRGGTPSGDWKYRLPDRTWLPGSPPDNRETILALLAAEWPRVTFALPPASGQEVELAPQGAQVS